MIELIEIANWHRVRYFDLFVTSGNLINNASVLFDCTEIYNYSKQQRVPFIVTMLHAALCGMNHIKEFRYRIINDEYLACYDQINLLTTELSSENLYYSLFTQYTPSLHEFYEHYREGRKQTKKHGVVDERHKQNINVLFICVLPNIRFTNLSPSSNHLTKRGCPFVHLGKVEVDSNGKVTIPVSISFSHALLDGYNFFKLADYLMYEYAKTR